MLQCVAVQTMKHYEAILIDDGSTDASGALCDEAAARDLRFRCVHQPNLGVSAARNRGMQEAQGDYIAFLDADDTIDENYFQVLLTVAKETNADITVCDVVVKENGKETKRFSHAPGILSQTDALNALLVRQTINSGPCAKLFRRELVRSLFFPPLKAYEDILFMKDTFSKAQRIAVTNKTAYAYLPNTQGAMSEFLKAPSLDIIKATDELLHFIGTRRDLSPRTFYITASHLMQYVQSLAGKPPVSDAVFIQSVQQLYRKYQMQILNCPEFPWKEKIVYFAFAYGWRYENKKLVRMGD